MPLYLSNIELQIISKYIYDFETFSNLLLLDNDLRYNYHTTFEIINLSPFYILTDNQVKKLINKMIKIFPNLGGRADLGLKNLEEIILNFNGTVIEFSCFNNYVLANYLKFCKYLDNYNNKQIKVKIKFNFKIRFYASSFNSNFLEHQSEFDFNLYILSKMIEQKIILNNINIIIAYNILYDDNIDNIKFTYESFNKINTNKLNDLLKINFITYLNLNMSFNNICYRHKNIDGFYFSHYSNGCFKFNNTNDECLLYGNGYIVENISDQIRQKHRLTKDINMFPIYYEIIKLHKYEISEYKLKYKYLNHCVYYLIKYNEKFKDYNYIRIYSGKIYKHINISDRIELLMKNGKYQIGNYCDRFAMIWYDLQDNILEYFDLNERYKL